MENQHHPKFDLAAPCGLYCGSCRQYLAKSENKLKEKGLKQGCDGCRIRFKNCTFVRKSCKALRKNEIDFCYECTDFPCENLQKFSDHYVKHYHISLIENLKRLKRVGLDAWINEQEAQYTCPECQGRKSIHDKECFNCEL